MCACSTVGTQKMEFEWKVHFSLPQVTQQSQQYIYIYTQYMHIHMYVHMYVHSYDTFVCMYVHQLGTHVNVCSMECDIRTYACVYLVFSPPRPPMSFSALSSFFVQISTSVSSWAFFFMLMSNCCWRLASLSCTSFRLALFASRSFMATFSSAWASFSLAFLGATTLATL